jgi:hypothetical protein
MTKPLILALLLAAAPAHAFDFESAIKGALEKKPAAAPAPVPASGTTNATSPTSVPAATSVAVDKLKPTEINGGLKEALATGAVAAVTQLGAKDGFFGNDALRIPLPKSLKKAEKVMKMLGMGDQAASLELAMNRAAEAAVPEAKTLLVDAVKSMTLDDARGILTGGKTSATDFFRTKTEVKLTERFSPIVKATTDKVGLAQQYNQYAGMAAQYGVVDKSQATVEQYVTAQALDRLYKVIGEKEAAIRANPLQAGSDLLKKVFGAVAGK